MLISGYDVHNEKRVRGKKQEKRGGRGILFIVIRDRYIREGKSILGIVGTQVWVGS